VDSVELWTPHGFHMDSTGLSISPHLADSPYGLWGGQTRPPGMEIWQGPLPNLSPQESIGIRRNDRNPAGITGA
jgi:hypothetical protein